MVNRKSKKNRNKQQRQKKNENPQRRGNSEYLFNNTILPTNIPLIDFCSLVIDQVKLNPALENSPDYHFSNMIVHWENKDYESHRISAFLLLMTIYDEVPSYITRLMTEENEFILSERLLFIHLDNISEGLKLAHVYYKLIDCFIRTGAKGRNSTYFKTFMKVIANKKENSNYPLHHYDDILLRFYEYYHRVLIKNDNELNNLTLFIYQHLEGEGSQSLYFFLSYFCLNKNDQQAIDYALTCLNSRNYADGTSYNFSLCKNTIRATIRCNLWHEYDKWMDILESAVGGDNPELLQLREQGECAINKALARHEHPINPTNVTPITLDSVKTEELLILLSIIDGCGGDWGIVAKEELLRYTFPSKEIANKQLINLLTQHILKISVSDFSSLKDDDLYNFDSFINLCRFHLNIIGISDTKTISLKVLQEEVLKRGDIKDSIINLWRKINLGYFYNTLEYYLSKISERWAQEFLLNENTRQRLENIITSARRLSFSAYKSVNSTVGFHELQSTGTKHTQNMLLHEINKYISFIEQSDVDYSKPRYDKMPILSVERQLYNLFNLEPAILYNEVPSIGIVENCMLLDEF